MEQVASSYQARDGTPTRLEKSLKVGRVRDVLTILHRRHGATPPIPVEQGILKNLQAFGKFEREANFNTSPPTK